MSGYTQEQLDALKAAAAKGVTKLRMANGEEVTFRTFEEMQRQISVMERALAPGATVRQHYPTYSKGT